MCKIGIKIVHRKRDDYERARSFAQSTDTHLSSSFRPGTSLGTADLRKEANLMRTPVREEFIFQQGRQAVKKRSKRNVWYVGEG